MNIRDIEARTGLDRSNIRFYEREGLLVPQRRENGYRDYSEADLLLLQKIKLLRRLDFSLDEIRSLKSGDLSMDRAIESRLSAIYQRRRELKAAEAVCLSMQTDGVTFQSLDAEKYLNSFDKALSTSYQDIRPTVPPGDCISPQPIPWRRFFARSLDAGLVSMCLYIFIALIFRWNINYITDMSVVDWLLGLLSWGLLIPAEAFFLSRFGTTPGKWLMGIRLEHVDGRLLTFGEACDRTFQVFYSGEGCTIPLYSLWCNFKAYKTLTESRTLAWDFNCQFVVKDYTHLRTAGYGAATVLAIFLVLTSSLVPAMPRHKGENITVEEFVDNFNRLNRFHHLEMETLLPDGTFEGVNYQHEGTDGALQTRYPIRLLFEEENGFLTKISYERNLKTLWYGPYFDSEGQKVMLLSSMAYAWTDAGLYAAQQSNATIEDLINHDEGLFTADLFGTAIRYEVTPLGDSWDSTGSFRSQDYHVAFSLERKASS